MTTDPAAPGTAAPAPATARPASPVVGLIGLVAVLLGGILSVVGFLGGIDAALNGSGNGAALYTGLFILGGVLVLAGIVFAIVRLVQGRNRLLAAVTLVIGLLPVIGVIVLRIAAMS